MLRTAAGLVAVLTVALPVSASAAPQRTWNFLTTGNGHGFQIYDTNKNKIVSFLEHPYRYLRPKPDPKSDGVGRRNLAYDFYFGVRGNGGSAWLNGAQAGDASYLDESNIIRAPFTAAGLSVETYYFAPFGYEGNAMVALAKAPGATSAFALFNFHMGAGGSETDPDANNESLRFIADQQAVVETGPGGGAMVYVALSGLDFADCQNVYAKVQGGQDLGNNPTCAGNDVVPAMQKKLGGDGWWAVAMQFVENAGDADAAAKALRAWAGTRPPEQILADARKEFEDWRKPPPPSVKLTADEAKVWRQGETTLRMGQVREPNRMSPLRINNGMLLASLPPGEWHTGWVRDGTYALVALARLGHVAEAKAALDFFLNARPVGFYKQYVSNADYQISVVRYFGTGQEEADYSGQQTPNVETDGWGLVLWAARQYVDASGDVGWLNAQTYAGISNYEMLSQKVAGALAQNMESNGIMKADSSIWEVHDANKRHYAYTTLTAARGLCDMATLAQRAGKDADRTKYQQLSAKVITGFNQVFRDPQGAIPGSLEGLQIGRYTDAAVVEAFNWSIITDYTGKTATATLDRLNNLLVASGGYKRNDDNASSYDNNEWILIDLRMSSALRRAGRTKQADALVDLVVGNAIPNFNLLPELYNAVQQDGQIGKYTGSIPMVGYGGGAIVMTLLDRGGVTEPFDCGSSVITDAGVVQMDGGVLPGGGGNNGGGGNGPAAPYVPACLCAIGHRGALHPLAVLVSLLFVLRLARRKEVR